MHLSSSSLPAWAVKMTKRSLRSAVYRIITMIVTCFPYQFFGANQQKADVKILSWIQCAISKDWRYWHILVGNDERIVWQNLNRKNWNISDVQLFEHTLRLRASQDPTKCVTNSCVHPYQPFRFWSSQVLKPCSAVA